MAKRFVPLELRHLHYFLAAAERGSFRKAAAVLGVQESSVSRRIRDLEDQLGASLFQRHNGGVRLTFAGQRFRLRAEDMLQHMRDSAQDIAAVGRAESGRIKVGILPSLAAGFLAELFRAYDQRHGGVHIDFIEGETAEHAAAIARLDLDAAFVAGHRQWPGCEVTPLWSEQLFVAMSAHHCLVESDELDWSALAGECFVLSHASAPPEMGDAFVQRLTEAGQDIRLQPQCVGRDTLLPLVAMGQGLALIGEAMAVGAVPRNRLPPHRRRDADLRRPMVGEKRQSRASLPFEPRAGIVTVIPEHVAVVVTCGRPQGGPDLFGRGTTWGTAGGLLTMIAASAALLWPRSALAAIGLFTLLVGSSVSSGED